jgi:hypothetical protein
MPASDAAGRDLGDLIRDIGRSDCRRSSPATTEQHLMRIAGDPLLLGEFLARKEDDGCAAETKRPVPGEVTIALARRILTQGSLEEAERTSGVRYGSEEPRRGPSLAPSVFEPSRNDREHALDLTAASPHGSAETQEERGAGPAVAALAVVLAMLVTLKIVWD